MKENDNKIRLADVMRDWKRRSKPMVVPSKSGRMEDFDIRTEAEVCSRCDTEIPKDDTLWLILVRQGLILCPECQSPDERRTRATQIQGEIRSYRCKVKKHEDSITNINSRIAELKEISAGLME